MSTIQEKNALRLPGVLVLTVLVLLGGMLLLHMLIAAQSFEPPRVGFIVAYGLLLGLTVTGFAIVPPNEGLVVTFFGSYVGTIADDGFHWTVPFSKRNRVSLRVRNFDSSKLKVNDASGNPIEIACVVVWRVVDSARACFDVEDYARFIGVQTEIALRAAAAHYPYDGHDTAVHSLRSHPDEVGASLKAGLQRVLNVAGIEVMDTRLSHLAYAPEIAQTMLRRQQAEAVIAARQMIVEGAVGMVQMALSQLESKGVVTLDDDKRAAMVNNLLVALVSEESTQPVINAGTIY